MSSMECLRSCDSLIRGLTSLRDDECVIILGPFSNQPQIRNRYNMCLQISVDKELFRRRRLQYPMQSSGPIRLLNMLNSI